MTRYPAIAAFSLLMLSASGLPAQVTTRVTPTSIAANEPVQVVFETDFAAGWPDLSPLEQDFSIAQRSTRNSTRSFNGRTTQRSIINLTLIPKYVGTLTIPAIAFGSERSKPYQITVTSAPQESGEAPASDTREPAFSPPPSLPNWYAPQGMNGWTGAPGGWGTPGLGMPGWDPPPVSEPQIERSEAAPRPAVVETRQGAGYWPWIAAGLGFGWLVSVILLWRGRGKPAAAASEPLETSSISIEPPPESASADESAAIADAIERAYGENDAFAAKHALLRWGANAWPDDPPTNLSRLAARCPSEIQRYILKLEEALYSPLPITWNEPPMGELLKEVDTHHARDIAANSGPNAPSA